MTLRKAALLIVGSLIVGLAGCGSVNHSQPPTPPFQPNSVIFIAPPPKSLAINASATLAAAATFTNAAAGASENTQVTWSVTCGSPNACGSFSANADLSGITYTAPAAIPSGASVTVTATSVADTTKSVSATIAITAPIPISVTFFVPPPASLQVNTTATLKAAIANDVSANPQVKWTVVCGAAACGSFNPVTTTSEGSTTYTAPAAIPPGGSVTVTASSITDPTKSASTNIVITATTPSLANGTYVFQLSGSPGNQASFMTGVFMCSNGSVTGGEQDWIYYNTDANDDLYAYPSFQKITGGSYVTTSDGNIQISLQLGASQVETLNGTLASNAQGFVAALNGSPASGTLDLQTSTAAPSGGYAVSLSGGDEYGDAAWIGGVLNIDSPGGISGAGSILDVVEGQAAYTGAQSLRASIVSNPDADGRFQVQLFPAATSTLPPLYLAGYVIDATHIRLIETGDGNDTINFQGVLGGTALGQGASTGHFSAASIAGSSYVFGAQGSDAHGLLQIAGIFSPQAAGVVAGTLNWNDLTGTSVQNPLSFSGSYTMDPTGRVTLSNLSDGSTFNYSLHLYLAANGNALLLSNDTADTFNGQAFQQQTAAFTAVSFSGSYGLNSTIFVPSNSNVGLGPASATGTIVSTPSGTTNTVAGFADTGNGAADFAIAGAFDANASGIFEGTLAGFNPAARTTPGNFTLYVVDGTQAVAIETDSKELTLGHLQNLQ